jgi:hypothetical protein
MTVSDKDIQKINVYRVEQWISAIYNKEGYKFFIHKTPTNYIRISTVKETTTIAVLRNDSPYKHLDCDNGLGVSNNSTYTLL